MVKVVMLLGGSVTRVRGRRRGRPVRPPSFAASARGCTRGNHTPFGELIGESGEAKEACPFRYSGKLYDSETGLYYYGYRYYDPRTAKWLASDAGPAVGGNPREEQGGINLTQFCNNDPINLVDPLGLAGYFFDGTWNHPHPRSRNGDRNYITHVYRLYLGYDSGERFYAYGIGSGFKADGQPYGAEGLSDEMRREGVTGDSMDDRINHMVTKLEGQLARGDKVVDVFGFSRGAASALEFLNRIQDRIDAGNPLYNGVKVRFVALIDTVAAIDDPLLFKSRDIDSGVANTFRFSLPERMVFDNTPVHLVSIDEQRTAFQVIDLPDALQLGFRGVHSELGGWYPDSQFSWIPLKVIERRAEASGVKFKKGALDSLIRRPEFNRFAVAKDPDRWYYSEKERRLPAGLLLHGSVEWFRSQPENSIERVRDYDGIY